MRMVFIFPNRKYKSIWRMPRLKKAMKDVAWRRYVSGRCLATFDPKMSEWGNLFRVMSECSVKNTESELGEVKHFSTQRKRDQIWSVELWDAASVAFYILHSGISLVVASEKERV